MADSNPNRTKEIKVDLDKCTGCRACEMACSAFHATPRHSSVNPARSRIRVVRDPLKDVYVPLRAVEYSPAECSGRHAFTVDGKEYPECSFCGVSCPARDLFKEPGTGLPLKCDMCRELPPLSEPLCVQVCGPGALTYHERESEREAEPPGEVEVGMQALVAGHGLSRVLDGVARVCAKASGTPR